MKQILSYNDSDIEVFSYVQIENVEEKYSCFVLLEIYPFITRIAIDMTFNLKNVKRLYMNENLLQDRVLCVEDVLKYGYIHCSACVVIAFDNVSDMTKYKLSS